MAFQQPETPAHRDDLGHEASLRVLPDVFTWLLGGRSRLTAEPA
ncbi:hypothetical protein [Streptomyces sp. NPDC055013]